MNTAPNSTNEEVLNLEQPTSPHLTIYKLQISSVLSIFHRITGVALFGSISIITWWVILVISSRFNEVYLQIAKLGFVKLVLYPISFMFFFHWSTGIRHLVWDLGKYTSIKWINITGWIAVVSAIVSTLVFWLFII